MDDGVRLGLHGTALADVPRYLAAALSVDRAAGSRNRKHANQELSPPAASIESSGGCRERFDTGSHDSWPARGGCGDRLPRGGARDGRTDSKGPHRQARGSIELMKQLWTGQEVTFEGRYSKVTKGRVGFTPYQKPHPPIEMGAQSEGATRRAARLADGVFFGPQVAWADIQKLAKVYREARAESGQI